MHRYLYFPGIPLNRFTLAKGGISEWFICCVVDMSNIAVFLSQWCSNCKLIFFKF